MGVVTDVLVTAAGSGGTLATLIAVLRVWLSRDKDRRVLVQIKSGDETIVIDAENVDPEALKRILLDIQGDMKEKAMPDETATD
jgi:hypothetical protein